MTDHCSLMELSKHLVDKVLPKRVDAILIGISTGGPLALSTLIQDLSPDLSCPIFIVIHIKEGFSQSLVAQLQRKSVLPIHEAEHMQVPQDGHIYIAPSGKHMLIKYNTNQSNAGMYRIVLSDSEEVNSCRPSVDVLFNSATALCNKNMLGVIMTGIGHDGAQGASELYTKGKGYILIQDQESSTVWGMPKNTLRKDCVSEIHSLDRLGKRINNIVLKQEKKADE